MENEKRLIDADKLMKAIKSDTSAISANYCSQFDTNQSFIKGFSGILNCTDKNRPVFIEGNDGYVRFSGTAAQIDALEFYEVLNFKWELPAGLSRSIEEYTETAGEPNDE